MNTLLVPQRDVEDEDEGRYPMQKHPCSVEAFMAVVPAFLELYEASGNISASARKLGFGPGVVRALARKDPIFEDRLEVARIEATDALEGEARRRAMCGVKKLVTFKGVAVRVPHYDEETNEPIRDPITDKVVLFPLYETEYSDRLMELLLRGHRPERFTKKHEHHHEVNGKVGVLVVPTAPSAEAWEEAVKSAPRPGDPEVVDAEFSEEDDGDWLT